MSKNLLKYPISFKIVKKEKKEARLPIKKLQEAAGELSSCADAVPGAHRPSLLSYLLSPSKGSRVGKVSPFLENELSNARGSQCHGLGEPPKASPGVFLSFDGLRSPSQASFADSGPLVSPWV